MINLMPSDMKEQIRYAKMNRVVVHYAWGLGVVLVALGTVFGGAFYLLNQQTAGANSTAANDQTQIAKLNATVLPKAKDASARLQAIKYVQSTQTRFSAVIADIAKVVPSGVSIDSMTLTGDDKEPVTIAVTGGSYNDALAFRNALTTSPRIADADLETITSSSTGGYQANVVVAFKPGEAK